MDQQQHTGNDPGNVYREELRREGSTFNDSPRESDARDQAKMDRAATGGTGQKIDGSNPFADEDSVSDEEMNKETYDDHK